MDNQLLFTIGMWLLGSLAIVVMGAVVVGLPYFFIRMIIKQMEYGKTLKVWGLKLKKRHTTQAEFEGLMQDMRDVKWAPNYPEYWGYCKNIFYATLHSHEIMLEQKRQLYAEFERLKVHGLPYPRERKEVR
ncbi:hypothetical protein [Exiguobacterium sp. TNDT2]|uniref:hypothetical protein n=1 Tax=Exiguobacterium sp. TNDT2 TaxID=2233531 RepID=UPI000DEFA9BB|nr:hypothetical protein [Exiguobacterium sp. TNDT2]